MPANSARRMNHLGHLFFLPVIWVRLVGGGIRYRFAADGEVEKFVWKPERIRFHPQHLDLRR